MKRIFGIEKFKGLLLAGSFATLVEFLMGLSDSIVAGNFLGEEALAGVNLLSPVMAGITFCAGMIGVGMGIHYAFESGRCQVARARQFFTQALWTVLIVGSALVAALTLGRGAFLGFMAPSEAIAGYAAAYWRWYVPSGLLEPLVVLLVNVAMADGDVKLCFSSYLVQLAVNLGVSIALIGSMGIAACSFGTFVANLTAASFLSIHFFRKCNSFRLVRHFSLSDTFSIVKSSFGDASSFLCSAALFFFLNKYVIANYGSGLLPVLSTVIATIGFLEIFNGVGSALSPIVTVYAGEHNTRAIRMMMRTADRWSVGEGLLLSVLLVAFPGLVVKMVGIDSPELVASAETAVRYVACGLVFYSVVYLYNSYYIFIEHEVLAVWMTVLNGLVMPILLVFAIGRFGPEWAWSALALAPTAAMGIFALQLVLTHGRDMFPLLLPRERDLRITMFDLTLEDREIAAVSAAIAEKLRAEGVDERIALRASLMAEEVFMAIKDRNAGRTVLAEATLDLNEGVVLTLRDDGEIFDITDADQAVSSLRTYLVASVMERQKSRMNLVTTGFNRNVFRF